MSKGYEVYIDDVLMPVAPSSISTSIKGKNETVDLINGSEFNLIEKPGLTELQIDFRLPSEEYAFAHDIKPQQFYLDLFERLKTKETSRVFSIAILRTKSGEMLSDSYWEYATLESYEISEDKDEGSDLIVSCEFKKFIPLKNKKSKITENDKGEFVSEEVPVPRGLPEIPNNVEAVKNDSLYLIAEKYLGDGEKYRDLMKINKISNPNNLIPGQSIKLKV